MKLIYRTRGDSSPQGKPRVYFTGHPSDLPVYREEIFADIFHTQNCAIYYDEEPLSATGQDGLLRELEQMQLFVIPVTSRFLFQPNRARSLELPFAMEHHIPILPLMQEQSLESAFNEACGDLQMLNKNDPDSTALPYTKKLEKFLAAVLVGDELAEKVRAAFDAYVFLSYRKKDRKYAQELMRLIHKNDFCRDIAIWYDEFLTPGENFNDAIADVLKKCSLFTLAVTPHVVEPGNYVMSLEYPEAKKSGKPILPAELVPTDKDTLQSSFQDIPPCVDARDEHALSAALLEAVQKLAVKENDGSPGHNFFIGLAYLNGIDVEVNRERALSLITGAAKSGLPEATEKLVHMYRSGDGVERDYRTAIRWQEKLADLRQARYEEHSTEADGLNWIKALWDLGDYLEELADLAAAGQAYERMRFVSEKLNGQFGSETTRRACALSYNNLGGIRQAEGRPAEAKEYFLRALEIERRLFEETGTVQIREDLLLSYDNLGDICQAEGRLAEARDYYLQSLALSKQLAEETGTEQARWGLAVNYSRLGGICEEEGNLVGAKDYYLQSLELSKQLAEETGAVQARQGLSSSYDELGRICEAESNPAGAKDYYLQSLELRKQLLEETGTVQAQRSVSVSCNKLGGICHAEGKLAEAKDYYLQSLELRKQLVEETGTIDARRILALSYSDLGDISRVKGNLAEAKGYYLQSLELQKQLAEETGTVQARQDLSDSCMGLGYISESEENLAEAKDYYLQSLELRKQLVEETGTAQAWQDLSASCCNLGCLCETEGNLADAKDYYLQSLELCRQLAAETGTIQSRQDLSFSCNALGRICHAEGKLAEAKDYYLQSLALRKQLAKETGTVRARQTLITAYSDMFRISTEEGNSEGILEYSEKWFRLCIELYHQTGKPEHYDQAAIARFNLGVSDAGDIALKKTALSEAYDIWCELAKAYPNFNAYAERRSLARERLKQLKRPKWWPFQ